MQLKQIRTWNCKNQKNVPKPAPPHASFYQKVYPEGDVLGEEGLYNSWENAPHLPGDLVETYQHEHPSSGGQGRRKAKEWSYNVFQKESTSQSDRERWNSTENYSFSRYQKLSKSIKKNNIKRLLSISNNCEMTLDYKKKFPS